MFSNKKKYLFKCEECGLIVSIDFESEKDLEQIKEGQMIVECPCSGDCKVLLD
jgi:hypothetical protein